MDGKLEVEARGLEADRGLRNCESGECIDINAERVQIILGSQISRRYGYHILALWLPLT